MTAADQTAQEKEIDLNSSNEFTAVAQEDETAMLVVKKSSS